MRARTTIVFLLACGAGLCTAPTATATTYDTDVTIHLRSTGPYPVVEASIRSPKDKCVAPRELELFKEAGTKDKSYFVGSTTTGVWSVYLTDYPGYPPPGSYYVKVKKRVISTSPRKRVCASDRSKTIRLGGGRARRAPPGGVAPTRFAKFKYDAGHETFKGKIASPDPRCIEGRQVVAVFQTKQPGTELVLGKDRAGAGGKFKVEVPGGPPKKGKYYGLAMGRANLCDLGYSKTIKLKPE